MLLLKTIQALICKKLPLKALKMHESSIFGLFLSSPVYFIHDSIV